MWASKCPVCGGKLEFKVVEELVKGSNNVALVKVKAAVCHKCGEVLFDAKTSRRLEKIASDLQEGKISDFAVAGHTYLVKTS